MSASIWRQLQSLTKRQLAYDAEIDAALLKFVGGLFSPNISALQEDLERVRKEVKPKRDAVAEQKAQLVKQLAGEQCLQ